LKERIKTDFGDNRRDEEDTKAKKKHLERNRVLNNLQTDVKNVYNGGEFKELFRGITEPV
jgi:hypothetical protein